MGMHTFLPSRWLAVIVFPLFCVAILGGLFFLYKNDIEPADSSSERASLQVATQRINSYIAETDTDKDGLPNWEEVLWKTDPTKADTDGDGTPDGREVLEGRDPARAGPNDFIDTAPKESTDASRASASSNVSTTDTVGKELFGSYLALKKANALDDTNKRILIDKLGATISQHVNFAPYTTKDITVVEASPAAIAAYDTKAGTLLYRFAVLGKTKKNEIVLLKEMLEKRDFGDLTTIADDSKIYGELSLQLRAIPAPKDIAQEHLTLVNSFQVYADMATAMSNIQVDPVLVVAYIGRYQSMEADAQKALSTIIAYLAAHKAK